MIRFRHARAVLRTAATLIIAAGVAYGGTSLLAGHNSGPRVITAELTGSSACAGPSFCISSVAPAAALYPGVTTPSNLVITFLNPMNVAINVYSLTIGIAISPTTTTTTSPGCDLSALKVTVPGTTPDSVSGPNVTIGYPNATPYTSFLYVGPGSSSTSGLASYDATLSLADTGLNQNACEGKPLTLTYIASAYYTNSTSSVLGSSTNPSTAGQQVTLTDTVTSTSDANTPTGSVSFFSCASINTSTTPTTCNTPSAVGTAVPLSGAGVATTTTTPATAGTYYYEAIYTPPTSPASAATNFSGSTSNVLTQTVNAATNGSKIMLWSSANPTEVGNSVTYLAEVVGPFSLPNFSAGGTMSFSDNGVAIASCKSVHIVLGFATCTVTYPTTANSPHTIIATYSGDTNNGAGTSNTVSETVNKATPNNVVTETGSATLGGTLKFTATLSGPSGAAIPTGPVTWHVTVPAGATNSCTTSSLSGGTASCSITASKVGSYSVSDSYNGSGDLNYTSDSSSTDTVSVPKFTPTVVETNTGAPALGGSVKFTATVTGILGFNLSGSISWNVAGSSGITSCGSTTALAGGVATCTITASKAGSYVVSASYNGSGDPNYNSASSSTETVTVAKATPTNVVTNSGTPVLGGTVKFTATITGVSGIAPTGSVTWNVSGSAGVTSCGSTTALTTGGIATCTITASKAGSYAVSDSYSGDGNYVSLASNPSSVTVAKGTSSDTLKSSLNPTTVGAAVTYTATVTGAGVTPSGSVTFKDGASAIISCGTNGVVNLSAAGVATCSVTYTSTAGSAHTITAPYGGDGNYNSAVATAVSETVNKATPTNKVANSTPITLNSKITFTATLAGPSGAATPTGSVTWHVSVPSGVSNPCTTNSTLSSSGAASCSITASKSGTYSVSDTYNGSSDPNYTSGVVSSTDSLNVTSGGSH